MTFKRNPTLINGDQITMAHRAAWEMRVPGVIFASELLREMDDKVYEQVANVATLPGIVEAAYAMPDAHWGYGFPIGGVAAFDPDAGRRGVGRRRRLRYLLRRAHAAHRPQARRHATRIKQTLADACFTARIPAGVGSTGRIRLRGRQLDEMLTGGAQWAVQQGYGDSARPGTHRGARLHGRRRSRQQVSEQARKRQRERWARSVPAIITWKCSRSSRFSTQLAASAFGLHVKAILWSASIAARAAWATRSAPSS